MSDRTCSVDDCERPVLARGWCRMHYYRWYRHGTTDYPGMWANAPEGAKWCPRCSAYKPVDSFSRSKSTVSGFQSWCKPCMATNEIGRKRVLTEDQRAQRREYYRRYLADPLNLAKHSARSRRRRVTERAGAVEPYTSLEIAERDSWRCQICGKRIGRSFRFPHPRSLSVDHIVPISKGGDDVRANVQAAHLRCNISKYVGGTDQLRLIG